MALSPGQENIRFKDLSARLIERVNATIRSGDLTERGLSRILGLSQPQIHNVLKGVRKLRPELADRLMEKFGLTMFDLMEIDEPQIEARRPPAKAEKPAPPAKERAG